MVATRGRTFKRPWRRSCLSSKLKSSSAPIGRKDSWCFHAVGSSNAPLLGSTAAEGLPRIGRTSIATRWRSCGLPQSASCSENFVIPPDVFGQTLSRTGQLEQRTLSWTIPNRWVLVSKRTSSIETLARSLLALPVQAMVLLHPKEVPLCLTGTVSKICWRFCTGTLRRTLTRSHSIVGALSMAICQWDSKSTVWATGVSSLLWWKVLAERKKFSMSTTTNTPTPRSVLCCPRWAVLVRRYSFLSVSSTLLDLRFSVTRKFRSRYALQGDLALVVRHCWR